MNTRRKGFSLVELLVVIFIIGVLISILIPAISAARLKAREAAVTAEFSALAAGIETFRGESALGGTYPPSAPDDPTQVGMISDPRSTTKVDTPDTPVTGAHLLAQAMAGADRLGPPGFVDIDNDGTWADDTHAFPGDDSSPAGAYGLDPDTGEAKRPRYGGGVGFVNESARERLRTLNEMLENGSIQSGIEDIDAKTRQLPVFVDAFERPILYYRANPSARTMLGSADDPPRPGVYTQEHNGLITGMDGTKITGYTDTKGLDFGAGVLSDDPNLRHAIAKVKYPKALPAGQNSRILKNGFDNSFARFIWNKSVTARNEPVRKDTFLLISAGNDGVYGTADDIINWTRQD